MTPTITPIIEEKRQLGAAVAIVDIIFEIVEVIKNAAAADEEVRFLMSINCWSYTCPDFIFFVYQKRNKITLETVVQSCE